MIATQAEIDLVKSGIPRRRQMWLPLERGTVGQPKACPVEVGELVRLQPELFAKGTPVTIISVELSTLGGMTDAHANQQGYSSLHAARQAWDRAHGLGLEDTAAWVIQFALGDYRYVFTEHREKYLKAKGVGLTMDPKLAVKGEPAVTTADQLVLAGQARTRREEHERQALNDLAGQMEMLRRTIDDPVSKRMLKRSIRNIRSLLTHPSAAPVNLAMLQQLGSAVSTSRPPDGVSLPSPESEEAA